MPERHTPESVTGEPCKCNYLSRAADDPRQPIVFDELTGEYHFEWREGELHGKLIIYHCPFCGGAAPKSKRHLLFHVIPPEEEERLAELLTGIKSLRGAIRKLGKPEYDNPRGSRTQVVEREGRGPATKWRRTLRYEKLSEVADVWFMERLDRGACWTLQGKSKH